MKQKLSLCNAHLVKDERCHTHLMMIDFYLYLCKKDRTKSSRELSIELVLSNGKRLSASTIHRRLNTIGLQKLY